MKSSCHANLIFAIGLIVLSPSAVLGWRSFKLVFVSFPVQSPANILVAKSLIQNAGTSESTISLSLSFSQDVEEPLMLQYAIALESTEEPGNFTILANRSLNFCDFLKQRSSDPMLQVLYEDTMKQASWVRQCPIRRGSYELHSYRLDEELLPSYVPETNFYFGMHISYGKKPRTLLQGRLNGRIDKSKGFDNLKMFSIG